MTDHDETRCPSCGGSDEQGCYADCPTAVITALRAEVERLKVENEAVLSANRDVMLHWDVLKADYEKLRAALKMSRPFIGWAGSYPTILAEVDAALEGPQDRMAKPLEEK